MSNESKTPQNLREYLRDRLCDKKSILHKACKELDGTIWTPIILIARAIKIIAKKTGDDVLKKHSKDWISSSKSYAKNHVFNWHYWPNRDGTHNSLWPETPQSPKFNPEDVTVLTEIEDIYQNALHSLASINKMDSEVVTLIETVGTGSYSAAKLLIRSHHDSVKKPTKSHYDTKSHHDAHK
jgi:hypothetical protein